MINYPPEITPLGEDILLDGEEPMMGYRSYDGNVVFHLMGGLAPWPGVTEGVLVKDIKGLIPPWKLITQKGATQDGVTVLDALYDPIEVDFKGQAVGNTPQSTRQVVRDWFDSWDPKQTGELFWITHEMGHWWAPVRWLKSPLDNLNRATACAQDVGMVAQADDGFWRSYDDTSSFQFVYESMVEDFNFTDTDLGANWPLYYYEGSGTSHPYATGTQAGWSESGTTARAVAAGPFDGFTTDTDNQVVEITLGSVPEIVYPNGAYNDIWGRMGSDGSGNWDGNGIRARIGVSQFFGWCELSRFNGFTKTVLASKSIIFRPRRGEKFRLICGVEGDGRMFRIVRNGIPVLSHKEVGTNSNLGPSYRGVGFGMKAGAGTSSQKSPAWVQKFSAGDNTTVAQTGFLACTNIGDQPMYKDFLCIGPGKFKIWDGPNSQSFVEFGPLAKNQVALLRSDPRDRNVYDLATVSASPNQSENSIFTAALNGLASLANLFNVAGILGVVQSIFGIFGGAPAPALPQGNLYRFLSGRFSDASAIPPKPPGVAAPSYHIKCSIDDGNADSKIIASGTPLRRWPM